MRKPTDSYYVPMLFLLFDGFLLVFARFSVPGTARHKSKLSLGFPSVSPDFPVGLPELAIGLAQKLPGNGGKQLTNCLG